MSTLSAPPNGYQTAEALRLTAPAPSAANDGTTPVIETRGLRKTYGKVTSLHGLDLDVPHAAIGLLGANGAGKTTLIRLLLGLAKADSGTAKVLGLDAWNDAIAVRQQVGYMPESDCLPPGATAADFVSHMAEMSGIPSRAARQRAADVLYQVGLDEERYRLIRGFSTGMKQRVKLAQAIVHDPKLVFLDEPTNGMDPRGRDEMLELVSRIYHSMGMAIVMSSHILEDIERVCDYVIILDQGQLMASQPIRGVGTEIEGELLVRIDGDPQRFIERLTNAGLAVSRAEQRHIWDEFSIRYDDERAFDIIRDVAADTGVALRSLRSRSRSLQDLYFSHVGNVDGIETGQFSASSGSRRSGA